MVFQRLAVAVPRDLQIVLCVRVGRCFTREDGRLRVFLETQGFGTPRDLCLIYPNHNQILCQGRIQEFLKGGSGMFKLTSKKNKPPNPLETVYTSLIQFHPAVGNLVFLANRTAFLRFRFGPNV